MEKISGDIKETETAIRDVKQRWEKMIKQLWIRIESGFISAAEISVGTEGGHVCKSN